MVSGRSDVIGVCIEVLLAVEGCDLLLEVGSLLGVVSGSCVVTRRVPRGLVAWQRGCLSTFVMLWLRCNVATFPVVFGALEALLPPQQTPFLEHVSRIRVQSPQTSFAWPLTLSAHLDEAVVEGEAVPNRVLPAFLVGAVVGEVVADRVVNVVQGSLSVTGGSDGHGDEANVREWRLRVAVLRMPTSEVG